jgi:exopolysaccharide biosynthesis predicted pyruvyltransferase EpsI
VKRSQQDSSAKKALNHLFDNYSPIQPLLDELEELCSAATSKNTLKYIANPGNAGDAVIASASWQVFDLLGLTPRQCNSADIRPGDTVILGGGGNLIEQYLTMRDIIKDCLARDPITVILLPHTIRAHSDLLSQLDSRFYIYCRELDSYNFCVQYARNANVRLSHDIGLFIDPIALIEKCKLASRILYYLRATKQAGTLRSILYWKRAILLAGRTRTPSIRRTDSEATNASQGHSDISSKYCSQFLNRLEADLTARDLIMLCSKFETVATDRLHVGIVAAALGKSVQFVDNNYGKISSIAEQSFVKTMSIKIATNWELVEEV